MDQEFQATPVSQGRGRAGSVDSLECRGIQVFHRPLDIQASLARRDIRDSLVIPVSLESVDSQV